MRGAEDYFIAAREVERRFASGERIVLLKTPDEEGMALASGLGLIVFQHLLGNQRACPRFGLVLTGGQTAENILRGVDGYAGLSILGQIEPGVVVGRIRCKSGSVMDGSPVLLKAGGFGEDDTLARCLCLPISPSHPLSPPASGSPPSQS